MPSDRPPTVAALVLLCLGVVAVWMVVTLPAVSVGAGLVATGLIVWVWWLWRADAVAARARRDELRAWLEACAGAAGVGDARVDEVAGAVGSRVAGLIEQQRAMSAVFDAIDEPVVALDDEGVVAAANRAAESLLAPGSSGALIGQPFPQLLPDSRALEAVRAAGAARVGRAQAKLLTSEGPRIVEVAAEAVRGAPFGAAGAPSVVVTLRDVTEQATAMQLKTDFVANASHELRTPLASIRSAAETLREVGGEDDAMRERLVGMIASNAERLEELSRDLLDLSSLESPEAEVSIGDVDLGAVAADLRELFSGACAQRGVGLGFEIDAGVAVVRTDERLVRLVLRNLIDNALKFAYEDTSVRVRAVPMAKGGVRLEVIDRGIGIPLAQQQRVFERFYQVDGARSGRRGTGLGLAIVKHALRALGGSIRLESVWQQGTTMIVELPARDAGGS